MPRRTSIFTTAVLFSGMLLLATHSVSAWGDDSGEFSGFFYDLEAVREALKIPGMSAAVVRDQQLIWAQGFGHADLENGIAATADTRAAWHR